MILANSKFATIHPLLTHSEYIFRRISGYKNWKYSSLQPTIVASGENVIMISHNGNLKKTLDTTLRWQNSFRCFG